MDLLRRPVDDAAVEGNVAAEREELVVMAMVVVVRLVLMLMGAVAVAVAVTGAGAVAVAVVVLAASAAHLQHQTLAHSTLASDSRDRAR